MILRAAAAMAALFFIGIPVSCRDAEHLTSERLDALFEGKAPADSFAYPLGGENALGYYNAQEFGKRNRNFGNRRHLGEDWNGIGGGNSDLGDPVHAIAGGYVAYAGDGGPGWGGVIRIVHRLPRGAKYPYLESLYGHVIKIKIRKGDFVRKGMRIGHLGNVNGLYYAHLHIELRSRLNMPVGGGYGEDLEGFLSLTAFIKERRRNH